MNINTSLSNFKKKHLNKKNQVIYYKVACKNNRTIDEVVNFLFKPKVIPIKEKTIMTNIFPEPSPKYDTASKAHFFEE